DLDKGVGEDKSEELLRCTDTLKTYLGMVGQDAYTGVPELQSLLSQLGVIAYAKGGAKAKSKDISLKAAAVLSDIKATIEQAKANPAAASRSDVRVDLKKLDALINLVGELVVAEAMVTGWVKSKGIEDEVLDRAVHHLKRTTLNLQDVAMSVRMVPVNQTFKKMVRLVHDTSSRLNKKVRLSLLGEETEVDKTVIEQIADPLVHCVRNSIDHGLETPEERLKAGKEEQGTITLEAKHEGGEVWIVIQDDGKGLNREKILDRARERGLFPPEKEHTLTDSEIFNFIFEPGFSTAEAITDVSGRGVGMDVVKKNIEKVKGKIRIESEAGVGTRVVFQIPLTLAIIDGMMIRVGTSKYTIPLLSIQESIRIPAEAITTGPDGLEMIDVRSNFIPIVRLDDLMTKNSIPKKAGDCVVVVVEVNNRSIALLVDEILGQQQTVIKALPAIYKHSKNVSGCSILANGDVSLILDVTGIAQSLNNDYEALMSSAA
ncbi:MAG: chemotaxis protein CheA, partial [Proteobacteria bacterium]